MTNLKRSFYFKSYDFWVIVVFNGENIKPWYEVENKRKGINYLAEYRVYVGIIRGKKGWVAFKLPIKRVVAFLFENNLQL